MKLSDTSNQILERIKQNGWQGKIVSVEHVQDLEKEIIFVAPAKDKLKGFVQLYPSFCSVDAVKIFILYDLYVDESDRKSGLGELLMNKATEFAKAEGASRIDLLTAIDNRSAQHLYEKLGYKRDLEDFFAYSLKIRSGAERECNMINLF